MWKTRSERAYEKQSEKEHAKHHEKDHEKELERLVLANLANLVWSGEIEAHIQKYSQRDVREEEQGKVKKMMGEK